MLRAIFVLAIVTTVAAPECGMATTPTSPQPTGSASNVQAIAVDAGPANEYVNGAFTSVTVCVPGSASNCQTIGGVLVDTGSSGLRLLASALTLSLPQQTGAAGSAIVECNQFLDGYTWGPVQTADVKMAGETAGAVPIQVIGASSFPSAPASCTSGGLVSEDTLATLGANGVLGIGEFRQDCGPGCTFVGASNPGLYYACTASGCQTTTESTAEQLQNPVWRFGADNNGVVLALPSAAASGAGAVTGSMIFGIGTESNNALGSATVLTTDANGNFSTSYQGRAYPGSFIDSGSNAYFFFDSTTTGLPACSSNKDFYCPSTSQPVSATQIGASGRSVAVAFSVGNADTLLSNLSVSVFPTLAGPNAGSFDWGLPFFYGRSVFTAIEGQSTPAGVGPYWAF